jgi:hypothetical protein
MTDKKAKGEEPAPDDLLDLVASAQIRANYRKALGKEHARISWDLEIKKIFRKKKDKDTGNEEETKKE